VSKAPCLRVPRALGEKAIGLAKKLRLFDKELKVQLAENYLYIPLIGSPSPAQIKELKSALPEAEVSVYAFPKRVKPHLRLIDVLEDKLPPHLLASLPHSIDFIGEIAVVEVPPELDEYKRVLGEAIMATNRRLRTVLAKSSAVKDVYRLREFEVIAGLGKTETAYKEHGCTYYLDLKKAYFSPRLSHEHDRVASQVKEGETVIDMFAGIGPFSVLIAKRLRSVRVYAIDVNPDAITYLKRNIDANRVQGKIKPILGDARQIIKERLVKTADRIIMNLPEKAIEYIDVACEAIKAKGGILHYYEFSNSPNPVETAQSHLTEAVKATQRNIKEVLSAKIVRAAAPFTWQVVVDAEIQ